MIWYVKKIIQCLLFVCKAKWMSFGHSQKQWKKQYKFGSCNNKVGKEKSKKKLSETQNKSRNWDSQRNKKKFNEKDEK